MRYLFFPLFMFAMLSTADAGASCSLPFEKVLANGGFSGLIDCSERGRSSAKIVGVISVGRHRYSILDFRFKTKPIAGGVTHGGQRILVIEDGRRFLGQYALSPPPIHKISVRSRSVVIDASADNGNSITFDENGPPARAYLDGEPVRLFK